LSVILCSCTDDLSFVTKTVGVGQDVTLACSRNSTAGGILFWFRLVAGNLPEVLGTTYFYGHAISNETPRITAKLGNGTFVLRITQTKLSDTALYYCEEMAERRKSSSNVTFLTVKEPDITAVVQDVPSDSVRPGDPVTLQCSVFSTSEKKTCPEQHRVFWFRAGSDESHPSLIYVHGNSHGECETSAESHSSQKCVYSFSQDVDASDTGTYYCAVATCGQILFGNGAKLDIEGNHLFFISILMVLAFNYVSDVFLQTEEDSLVYSVPNFTRKKAGRRVREGAKVVEGESIYSDVRVLGYE
uniref:Ig-like domain-containing protein n=1 Tax=Stegastes partitus TaxID=144197 RepID=A0A3B5B8G2_9TELE